MSGTARRDRLQAGLSRFGALSPFATFETFGPGARMLLATAEQNGEIAVHVVRGLILALGAIGFASFFGVPLAGVATGASLLTTVWTLAWLGLRSRHYRWLRFVLIAIDPWIWLANVALTRGALPAWTDVVRTTFGVDPTQFDTSAVAPPLLVFVALSGALRLDPRVAGVGTLSSVAAYFAYLRLVPLPSGIALFIGILIGAAGIVGANGARVIRYAMLKVREESILEAYVPESLPRDLASHGGLERAGRVEDVTLLLCDVRGFTQLSERLSPPETVTFVNAYLDAVCPPIASSGGVIDKFMGDGVLAFFEGGGNPSRALGAARQILGAIERAPLASGGPVRVGIALHSGEVLVGTIGPRTRREYTIISDAVNTVARLEELNKTYGSVIVASATTIAHVSEAERRGFEGPIEVTLRGRGAGISVHVLRSPS